MSELPQTVPGGPAGGIAFEAVRDFFRDRPLVFLGTGMSCALDVRFGMPALRDELLRSISPNAGAALQVAEWGAVARSLQDGEDLESSLNHVTDPALLLAITTATARYIAALDREYAFKIADFASEWPATRLLGRLVRTLPEGDPILHVVTPNYDLLLEHACDSARIPYTTGFCGGVERTADWAALEQCLVSRDMACHRGRFTPVFKHRKHVRLHKVHGSLGLFLHRDRLVENHAWMWDPPPFAQRVIVTPGLAKYETLQAYRQELLKAADSAIARSSQFLFLGYGFNDKHLEEYISRKLVAQSAKGLIVTRDSNDRIEALLAKAPKLWLICKSHDGTADGTRIANSHAGVDLFVPQQRLWDIAEFTTTFLGS